MARYDYHCPNCDTTFEVEHLMSERPSIFCPHCSHAADRVFSATGISFKGSGFYNTDHRVGSSAGAAKPSEKHDSSSSTDSSSSSSSNESSGAVSCACKNCPAKA